MGSQQKPPYDPDLAARVERFRAAVEAGGGPVDAIELGRSGLAELWRWLDQTHKLPARPVEENELRNAGPLPDWSRRRMLGQRLGPNLTRLLDGLAAHVTTVILEVEPDAKWVTAEDAYLGDMVPFLQLPGRSRVPIDDLIAELFVVLEGDRSRIELDGLDAFVDYVLVYGDPRPRSYGGQTAKEARALLELVANGSEARIERFLDAVQVAGGPRSGLDFSPESLVVLWNWLRSRPLPSKPIRDPEMRKHELPWWYDFSGRVVGQTLGPELVWLATGAADYLAAMIFRELPGSTWGLGSERIGADFREPLLQTEGGRAFDIHQSMAWLIKNASEDDERVRGPDVLRSMFDQGLIQARRSPEPELAPEPAYSVGHAAPATSFDRLRRGFARRLGLGHPSTGVIMFSETAAHLEDRRVDRFVRLLATQDGIHRAYREDREVVHVIAPDMSAVDLQATIDRAWVEAAPRPRSSRRRRRQIPGSTGCQIPASRESVTD